MPLWQKNQSPNPALTPANTLFTLSRSRANNKPALTSKASSSGSAVTSKGRHHEFSRLVTEVGPEGLSRQIEMIDTPGATLSGWRLLLMMMEHDIHHRSQIDTYAGLNGWNPPDIYFRSAETIAERQPEQIAKYRS